MNDGFQEGFRSEARELLTELESSLLELDRNRDDSELVGRAFRALHTIKGSGAMFGFDDIARFSHHLEAVFDQLRTGRLAATSDLIALSLAAGDQIHAMLDASPGSDGSIQENSDRILAELRKLTSVAQPPAQTAPVLSHQAGGSGAASLVEWRIHFRPGSNVMLNGTNPLMLLQELRELGELRVSLDTGAIPPLAHMDPEQCYVAWDMLLTTAAGRDAIRDIFIFVEDDGELNIEPATADAAASPPAIATPPPRDSEVNRSARESSGGASSVRVPAEKLDQLVNLVGELVTVEARLSEVCGRRDDPEILAISEEIGRLTADLRENSMSVRMLPLRNTFERFRRLVHDLGLELGKQAELEIQGADTELDKTVIDRLNDPLVHLIRNSMDHGIETPEVRRAAGKNPTATVRLSALHAGAQVLIRVSDDGRGLDTQAVRARAIEKGLVEPSAQLSEPELYSLILEPGFSTAREVTDVSGRGVGMDVVRRSVEALRGSIEIGSKPGAGLSVTLRLPLTMAIIEGLLVRVARTFFILPLANSLECIELTRQQVDDAHGQHLATIRGETIPYIRLGEYFGMQSARPEREQIMVVETEDGHYGLAVDDVLGNHQTVIKNLGRLYRDVPVISGATILGNGTVALILDPHRLVRSAIQTATQNRGAGDRNPQRMTGLPAEPPVRRNAFTEKEN